MQYVFEFTIRDNDLMQIWYMSNDRQKIEFH